MHRWPLIATLLSALCSASPTVAQTMRCRDASVTLAGNEVMLTGDGGEASVDPASVHSFGAFPDYEIKSILLSAFVEADEEEGYLLTVEATIVYEDGDRESWRLSHLASLDETPPALNRLEFSASEFPTES